MRESDSTPVESDPRQDKVRLVDPDPRHASPRSRQRASGDASSTDYEIDESLTAHASRRSRRSLLSMRLLCFNKLDLILRRSPTGRANARPMTGSVAVSKDGLQYRFVIPGTRMNRYRHRSCAVLASRTCPSRSAAAPRGRQRGPATTTWDNARTARPSDSPHRYQFQADARPRREDARSTWGDRQL